MKQPTIEQLLLAAAPTRSTGYSAFTRHTMQKIAAAAQAEIIHAPIRKIGVTKKESFMTKLLRQPKFALVAMAIAAALLLGGTAYAAYRLWEKPRATTSSTTVNQQGRLEALIDLQHCGNDQTANFEVKQGAGITPDDVAKIAQAACELAAIDSWAHQQWGSTNTKLSYAMSSSTASKFQEFTNTHIAFKFMDETWTLPINNDTQYIADGQAVAKDSLKKDDVITFISRDTFTAADLGAPASRLALAIIKLDLPLHYYSSKFQNKISKRTPCVGNTKDSCVEGASIDIFPRNEGLTLPYTTPDGETFIIEGEVVSHNGQTFTLKGSSGTLYTFTAIQDIFSDFNTNYGSAYQGTTVGVGDRVAVRYTQPSSADHTQVSAQQILEVTLLLELQNKQDPLNKY